MDKGFAQIPNSILMNPDISALEIRIYAIILGKSNKEGFCWASNKTFAEWCGCSEKWVSSTLAKLEKKELIKLETTTKNPTGREIYPLKRIELQFKTPLNYSSTNNTLSLKRKRANKKSDDFYSQWTPTGSTGTETLKEDSIFKATNGLYDSISLVAECKRRWSDLSPEKTDLYKAVLEKL